DRTLPLLETGPVETDAVVGDRPALVVETTADGVEADDVGAELSEGESAERSGDERRSLDHAQAREQLHGRHSTVRVMTRDKVLFFFTRKDGLSRQEFHDHYLH